MWSPVSLCTGVTYDRTSIQRRLNFGNTTCPANMLPVPSTNLVPNLTLRRLISLLFLTEDRSKTPLLTSSATSPLLTASPSSSLSSPTQTSASSISTRSPQPCPFPPPFTPLLGSNANDDAVRVLALVLTTDFIEDRTKQTVIRTFAADLNRSATALIETMTRT
ncbi:hypothetical protein J5N97_017872 [Dioscorea zingiberensis]|uniref:U-box domain-containing protein n=1 Tax=Dioscorea zingiberensis TaxID=325984 RepID=A0A9D5CN02_9LILI|nr:hypothetical protein J5N97_017872 [Dioscorea zingiberensis]